MSIHVAPRLAKAGPIGPGAGVLLTEYPLLTILGNTPQKKMRQAWKLGREVPWIRAAERVISGNLATVGWHLEDAQDEEVTDEYPVRAAIEARDLLEKPQARLDVGKKLTRRDLWWLTSRHLGLCGNAFWYLDQRNAYGIAGALLYIRPDRMTAKEDERGNLRAWAIDADDRGQGGTIVGLDEVLQFVLEPPDDGHFGIGLVESAMLKAQLSQGTDRHVAQVLSAGGRLSGLLSPKQGSVQPEQQQQMERDWRTVVEQPDPAKRLQIIGAPVDFTPTVMTLDELKARDLMVGLRDDLLGLWGVPLSQIGGSSPAGLNSGDIRKYDEAALWQNAIGPRLTGMREVIQTQLLDRWQEMGVVLELELDTPEFDDDSPRYDLLQKSVNTPLTNMQRLALIGLPPTGDPIIDNAILLPATLVPYAMAPIEGVSQLTATAEALGREPQTPETEGAGSAAGETTAGKAIVHPRMAPIRQAMLAVRTRVEAGTTPALKTSVAAMLRDQRRDIAARIRAHAAHITANPRDSSIWFDRKTWDQRLRDALRPALMGMADSVSRQVGDLLPPPAGKAMPQDAVERVLKRGAARVVGINDTTRQQVQDAIAAGIEEGLTVQAVADRIETDVSFFSELRAETIARTELMDAYNAAALGTYQQFGVTQVQAIDGDGDPECAARDGQVYDIEAADAIEDHPNGTLDWVPLIEPPAKARRTVIERGDDGRISALVEYAS